MNAEPHPGTQHVGGATPRSAGALTDEVAGRSGRSACEPIAGAGPAAVLAALSWQANEAVRRQVDVTFAMASLARVQAESLAASVERDLPEGPFRDAAAGVARVYVAYAKGLAQAATRFGRHFGHLAFAFPLAGPGRHAEHEAG